MIEKTATYLNLQRYRLALGKQLGERFGAENISERRLSEQLGASTGI